jgi:hypothetical protein
MSGSDWFCRDPQERSCLFQGRRRIEGESRREERLTGRHDPHAGRQRRSGAAGIVIVVVVARLFDGDLSVALHEGE